MTRVLNVDTVNERIKKMEYAVRGPIVLRASQIEYELEQGVEKPFTQVVRCNIGDCHATGQAPLTFLRQVVSCTLLPNLMNEINVPSDVADRVNRVLNSCKGHSIGSYSDSMGLKVVRRDVATYISKRDGHPCDFKNVFISSGASDAIKSVLQLVNCRESADMKAGVMIPIPQYPLYSATLIQYDMHQISYYLDEDNHWSLEEVELQRALDEARKVCTPRALCVINPGNPTGQVLSLENIEAIIRFAHRERLVLLADEVYQGNVYAEDSEFHSFKKVLMEMPEDIRNTQQLASFMSVSKGYVGECGLRAGYCELVNLEPDMMSLLRKSLSVKLCPSVTGQVAMECVVNPPNSDEPSYKLFSKEKKAVLDALKHKAYLISNAFNDIQGISCNQVQGAMYCFPKLDLPQRAVDKAKERKQSPDEFYCFELLEQTGMCVVPGTGFGQRSGTYHFRCTILPQVEQFQIVMKSFKAFHESFMEKWQS